MSRTTKLFLILFIIATRFFAQDTEIDGLIKGELKMTYPRVYFKNNVTDYAAMPYSTDSCFKYIAANLKAVRSFVIWRDSSETEQLTTKRIKKLKADLHKYTPSAKIYIESMKAAQKISQFTIKKSNSFEQTQYLLSLNSVFDVYTTGVLAEKDLGKKSHVYHPRFWCFNCWRAHRFTKDYKRLHVKQEAKN
ncbi:MAG TPA: hypothetical protein VNX01_07505 [Bacteroidia bacterium]|jgi:hypothetical protein|nr:hypothetical protein [Bacteroidia bacterium]